jgi:ribosome-binding factor A
MRRNATLLVQPPSLSLPLKGEGRASETAMTIRGKGKPPSQRQLKVGETVRHALAEIFTRGEIVDEVLDRHSLTVPEVRMTPDLKLATVFVIPLGGGVAAAEEAVTQLDKHKRFLRGLLAKRVSLKFMPELRFKVDTSFEASARIDALLASPKVVRDLDS